ncbi:LPP20 family lipoprotein [Gayadomonas joobiniege]|uniref:LPP20 family lipoprotein n=1 Tax=Gayadomonas joobiniege TaxID=1234606 RepID=UPI00035DADAF|nr:LPP20 family lipoprotein [Gayadomonas joobiniege]
MKYPSYLIHFCYGLAGISLVGCQHLSVEPVQVQKHHQWQTELPDRDMIISAVGYAPVAEQVADSSAARTIKAIKASKLDAYRTLSEKIHGLKISAEQNIADLTLQNENLRASLQGVIQGARVVKTYQLDGVYVTEMELNLRDIYRIRAFLQPNQKLISADYY